MKRKLLLFALLMALFAPWAAMAQSELTVYDGTITNSIVPAYMSWFDDFTRSQYVIPADDLAEMNGGTISSIKFYCTSSNVPYTSVSTVDVYLMEVGYTTMTALEPKSNGTIVYQGFLDVVTEGEGGSLTIEFDTPYTYGGGNLLVGIENTTDAGYKFIYFYGQTVTGAAWAGYDGSSLANVTGSVRDFIPKTTFTYTPGSGPTCDRPAEVTYEDLTSTSVTIKWNGGSGTYNMEYKKASDATWTSVLTNSSATSAELTSLTPATNYVAKVQSVCVFNDTTLYREKTVNFTTECDVITSFPWSEDFEDYATGNFTDPCWVNQHISGGGTYIFGVSTSYTHGTSTKQLYLPDMSSGTLTKLVLPEMNLPGNDYLFAINVYRNNNYSSYTTEGIRVYASTDGEIEGATELAFIPRVYSVESGLIPAETAVGWYEYELPIGFSGKCFIILRGESQYGNATYMDDFSVKQLPSCQKPKNLALVSKTGHEAKVRWVPAVAGQTQWQFSLTPQGGTEQIIGPETSTDSTYTFTGLAGQTTYTVNVRAYCDTINQSEWSANALTFTTDVTCVAPTAFTVSDVTNRGATLKWTSEADAWQICLNDDETNLIDVTENPYTLSGLSPETSYTVKVRANCGSVEGLSSWTTNRSFNTLVAYPAPGNPKCDSVLADRAYLSWTELGTATDWEVIYKLASATVYDTLPTFENHPFILERLLPDSNYVFKVRSIYPNAVQVEGGNPRDTVSVCSSEVSFRTLQTCPAPTDFAVIDSTITANTATFEWNSIYSTTWDVKYRTPASIDAVFTEGFEDNGSNVPTGWTHIGNGSLVMNTTASRVHTGTYSLRFTGATSNNVVVLPKLGAEANTMEVSYWSLAESSTSSGTFQVGYVTDTTDVTTFQQIASYNAGEHLSYTQVNVSLASAPEGARVAFRHTSVSSSYWWWIDDVVIGTPIAAGTWQTKVAEEVPFELTGLEPLTDYEVVVVGNCANNEESDPSQTVFFTTLPSCLAPEGLALANVLNNLTAHTATLSWTAKGTETEWWLYYAYANGDEIVKDSVLANTNPYKIEGLLAETQYTAKVQANCSATDQSEWSDEISFTTPVACPAPINLAVDEESITTTGATITWIGTSSNYILQTGTVTSTQGVFFEGFEDTETFANWTVISNNTANTTNGRFGRQTAAARTDDYGFSFSSFTSASDYNQYLISPQLNNPSKVEFYYKHYNSTESFRVGYSTTTNDLTAFTWGDQINSTNSWQLFEQTLSSDVKYIAINYFSNYQYELYIDDITIQQVMDVYDNWTTVDDEAASPYTFDQLTPGTNYAFRVIGDCGEEGESLPSNYVTFTTVATCLAPEGLALANVNDSLTPHTATLSWTEKGTATEWWVYYAYANGNELVEDTVVANTNPYVLEGLRAETEYTAKVQAYCNEDDQSAWSEAMTFTTLLACHTPTNLAVDEITAFGATLTWDGASDNNSYIVMIGEPDPENLIEGTVLDVNFDDQVIPADWTNDANYPWTVVSGGHNGTYCIKSGNTGIDSSTSSIQLTVNLAGASTLSFYCKVSCEDYYDYGYFLIDSDVQYYDGETGWEYQTFNLEAGEHTLTWVYYKDYTTAEGDDCFYVDDIMITGLVAIPSTWTPYPPTETNEHIFDSLSPETVYWVKVVGVCDNDEESMGNNMISFTTLEACSAPTNLLADNVGTEGADLMWDGGSDSYIVQYRPWIQVDEDKQATGEFVTYPYDLSEFSGIGSIAIRHYDISDLFWLNVDDIVLTNAFGDTIYTQNFESCNGNIPSEITTMDLDGDGYDWQLIEAPSMNVNGSYGIGSQSYDNNVGALTPDNWLIISGVELGGQLSFAARGQQEQWAAENFGVFVSAENGFVVDTVQDGETIYNIWEGLTPNTLYSWQVKGICGEYESDWASSFFTTEDDRLVFETSGDWNDVNNWNPQQLPTTDDNVLVIANAIIPEGVVAEANKITIEGGSITIKDGGQLKHNNPSLKVTMEKEIDGYNVAVAAAGEDKGLREDEVENNNYYLIATPLNAVTMLGASTWNHVDSLSYAPYDLYTFDPANGVDQEWVNFKFNPSHANFVYESNDNIQYCLVPNEGYLYANADNKTLVFTGSISKSISNSVDKAIAYTELNKGWALVGNSFSCNAYLTVVDDESEVTEANYYVMNDTGDDFVLAETADGIAPMTAAFVNFDTTDIKVRISTEMPEPEAESNDKFHGTTGKFIMNLSQNGNNVDKAVVRFGKGLNLEKMSLKNSSKLYIPMKDKEYAVVYNFNASNMPVGFKAETAGSYTINFAAEGVGFKELVLIDNVTKTKVDLLANPSYTFETKAGDYANRFTITYVVK